MVRRTDRNLEIRVRCSASPRNDEFGEAQRTRTGSGHVDISAVKALVFDVFGTCVDWRTSLINDLANGRRRGALRPTGPLWSRLARVYASLDG